MIKDIKLILTRSPRALAQDAAGVTAISVILAVGLHLPNLL